MKSFYYSLFLFFVSLWVFPQDSDLICNHQLEVAGEYLRDFGFASHTLVDEIHEAVKNCDSDSANADYVFGMLGRFYAESEEDLQQAFSRIQRAATNHHREATKTLALMLKEGEGCLLDLDASVEWLEKAHELGDVEAAYILGYYYLKGLGTVRQSYSKAVKWFSDSHYPMAKHWLAVCQYHGFGMQQNKEQALATLKENRIDNSLYLYEHHISHENDSLAETQQTPPLIDDIANWNYQRKYVNTQNLGDPKAAYLLVWDWSERDILQVIPISLNFDRDAGDIIPFVLENNGEILEGEATPFGNQMGFTDFSVVIPNLFPDHEAETDLFVEVFTAQFVQSISKGIPFVLGELEGWVANFNEPAPPMTLLLVDPWNGLQQEEQEALEADKENIIANYPNQFTNDLVVRFTLENEETVQASIRHFNLQDQFELLSPQLRKEGEHIIRQDTTDWPGGLYVIQLQAGTQIYHKLIVKKQ